MQLNETQLKQALSNAFEEGWNSTGQGCNAEHHNISSEGLAQMRDDAVAGVLEGLKGEVKAPERKGSALLASRHDQLFAALTVARQNHRKNPTDDNWRAIAAARVPMIEFNSALGNLKDQLFTAKRDGNAPMVAELEKRIEAMNRPHDDSATIKLVDTAGTLRLDLNDRRTHMTREQALELFVALGAALDPSGGEARKFVMHCEMFSQDFAAFDLRQSGDAVGITVASREGSELSVNIGRGSAISCAVALVTLASEVQE